MKPWTEADLAAVLQRNRDLREKNPAMETPAMPSRMPKELRSLSKKGVDTPALTLEAPRGQKQACDTDMPLMDRFRSKTEQRFAEWLAWHPDCREYWYEPCKLWLAPKTTLTIDFLAWWQEEPVPTFYEIKAQWFREDGWVKLKIAAAMYPCFPMYLVQWVNGLWIYKQIPSY